MIVHYHQDNVSVKRAKLHRGDSFPPSNNNERLSFDYGETDEDKDYDFPRILQDYKILRN